MLINFREDIVFLEKWLIEARALAQEIDRSAKTASQKSFFTISTTAKKTQELKPFLTPLRRTAQGYVGGAIVFTQTQARILCREIDGLVDSVLIDAEKKLDILIGHDADAFSRFKLEISETRPDSVEYVEMGNLSAGCRQELSKSRLFEYKPNDITVEAAWQLLASSFGIMSGRKVAVIGAGNIGFKLALKLIESGCSVELVRRDHIKGMQLADTLNLIKPKSTIARASYNANPVQACLFCDAIIGCTDGVPAITKPMVKCLKRGGIILDVGKGCVAEDAIDYALEKNIKVFRSDIAAALDGMITTISRNDEIMASGMERREIEEGLVIISRGLLGKESDIVVDDCHQPTLIIGVADGKGDLKRTLSADDERSLKRLLRHLGPER